MTKRKLFLLILLFIVYEAVVWLASLLFLADSALLVGFVLTVCGLTVLLVYFLVARLSGGAPAPAGLPAAPRPEANRPLAARTRVVPRRFPL